MMNSPPPRTDEYDAEDMEFIELAYQVSRIGSDFDRRPRRAYTLGELTQCPATKQWLAQQNRPAIRAYRDMKREIVRKRVRKQLVKEKEERQDAEYQKVLDERRRLSIERHDIEVAEYLANSDMTEEQKEFYWKVIAGMNDDE